ncbi:uncharacterized protein [Watersipora subatra]|uniref:uncharacterized protein n=1 Tax=Watersipora subatra TaxID=2589382 RepID=UPI00355AD113
MAEGTAKPENEQQLGIVRETVTCGICLQLFTDPRRLTCSHIYCLLCLKGFQKSSSKKECPVCRALSIPGKHELDDLHVDILASNLVKLVQKHEPSSVEEAPTWQQQTAKSEASDSGSDSSSDGSQPELGSELQGLIDLTSGLDDLRELLQHMVSDSDDESGEAQGRHIGVVCDGCRKRWFNGARFKCGVCPDFDLCEDCEKKPRNQVHPTDYPHVFVKLKKPSTTPYPGGSVLLEEACVMGMTMDITKQEHRLNLPDDKVQQIECKKCNVSPIKGTRFKCGVCADYDLCEACEVYSDQFHSEKHPFLVFKHPVNYHTTTSQLKHQFY